MALVMSACAKYLNGCIKNALIFSVVKKIRNKCIMGQPAVILRDGPRGPLWRDHVYDAVRACMAWKPRRHYLAPRPPNPVASTHALPLVRRSHCRGRPNSRPCRPDGGHSVRHLRARLGSQSRPCRLGKVARTLNPRTGRRPARWCGQRARGCQD